MKILCSILFIAFATASCAQIIENESKLFIPLNVQNAYEDGTRNYDGTPGPNYWQNGSDYNIKVELNPLSRKISGWEKIIYHNNSPNSLSEIVIRLYQDFFKRGNARDFEISPSDITNGVEITKIKINETDIDLSHDSWITRREGTNLIVNMKDQVVPNSSVQIEIEWSFIVSKFSNVRMGRYDSTSYFIGYWYPQIAVYDDIDGWDKNEYTGYTEFYNDFSNYEVEITVPENFIVWATGTLQNPQEVLEDKYLYRYKQALQSDEIINIVDSSDIVLNNITKKNGKNIWKYKAECVPDFAFATSDHYLWDASSLVVDSDKRVLISAAFNKKSKDFFNVAQIARESIKYFSNDLPGVPYPYPSMTVFNGQGGMEYPMMVNDGSTKEWASTVGLTSHEILHTYFPFYMGTNERKYAWMDEGWAVMLPFKFQTEYGQYDPIARTVKQYEEVAGSELDVPLMILSTNLKGYAYRTASYNRSGVAYEILRDMLGEEKFNTALHHYMKNWNGKHPIPYDFFFSFDNAIGEDLAWFWLPWFFDYGYPDLRIKHVQLSDKKYTITIEKVGIIPVPIDLNIYYTDGTTQKIYKTANIWQDRDEIDFQFDSDKKINEVKLGNDNIPDAYQINNHYKK